MRIIVIDDEPKIRNGLRNFLSKEEKWEVVEVFDNALSALDFLQEQEVDVIITDIKMPEMNGLEMIARLRELNDKTCIIILSGYNDFDFAQRAIELGVYRYMLKPTNLPQLREILMQIDEILPGMETHPTTERAGVQNFIVSKAMDYIETNYMNKIELDDIAAQVYVTRNYLSSLFKKHTGVTVVEYITEVRLSKAKEYLKIPGYSMSEIAKKIGMKSARYFSSSFKEKYGLTPTEYRHKME